MSLSGKLVQYLIIALEEAQTVRLVVFKEGYVNGGEKRYEDKECAFRHSQQLSLDP